MRDRLVGLLEKADLVIGAAAGVAEPSALAAFATTVKNARNRLNSPDDVLIVALMGGTGSGKSSLFNVLAGTDLAEVGGVRPTTGNPMAAVPEGRATALDPYLDDLGIEIREVAPVPKWLCLVDMPDTDSVELDHRFQAEILLGRLDVVIWVVDPEKYRDSALHDRYVKPLAAYADQFVFVLNQVDRLAGADRDAVAADFLDALESDGLSDPTALMTVANPTAGPPRGTDDLSEVLERLALSGTAVFSKLAIDLSTAAEALLADLGPARAGTQDSLESLADEITRLALNEGARPAIALGGEGLEGLAGALSEPVAAQLRQLSAQLPVSVQAATEAAGGSPRKRRVRWSEPTIDEEKQRSESAEGVVRHTIIEPAQEILTRHAEAHAALVDLSLAIASVTATGPNNLPD